MSRNSIEIWWYTLAGVWLFSRIDVCLYEKKRLKGPTMCETSCKLNCRNLLLMFIQPVVPNGPYFIPESYLLFRVKD